MKIGLGSDHGGYNLKKEIVRYLEGRESNVLILDLTIL